MIVRHRIPWSVPYAYTEVESDAPLTEEEITNAMYGAAAMEESYRATYSLPKIGESAVVDDLMRGGATPSRREPAPQPRPVPHQPNQPQANNGDRYFWCKNCQQQSALVKAGTQPRRSKFAPYQLQFAADCTNGCKNDKGYPLTTWVDAD